ncbi:MAG: PEP-CTERM sorting domain-containing protein, partial [Myxococcota bacterium]
GAHDGSTGSIIATVVPEPNTALLMGLGLMGLTLAGRKRTSLQAIRNRSSLPLALSAFMGLLLGFDHPATAYSTLTGSGNHLIAPSPNPDPFYTSHTWTNVRIPDPLNPGSLVFDPPAGTLLKNPWQGNFQQTAGSGLGSGNSGVNTFNFAGLNGDLLAPGTLAAESLISINDLDEGGGAGTNEWLRLTAYDPGNSVIQTPWLSTLVEVSGSPNGNSDPLPGWDWDGSSYLFDTQFVGTPNPGMLIRLITMIPIAELHLEKDHVNFSVGFGAQIEPIPEPSTALLVGIGLMGLGAARRQRRARA